MCRILRCTWNVYSVFECYLNAWILNAASSKCIFVSDVDEEIPILTENVRENSSVVNTPPSPPTDNCSSRLILKGQWMKQ